MYYILSDLYKIRNASTLKYTVWSPYEALNSTNNMSTIPGENTTSCFCNYLKSDILIS